MRKIAKFLRILNSIFAHSRRTKFRYRSAAENFGLKLCRVAKFVDPVDKPYHPGRRQTVCKWHGSLKLPMVPGTGATAPSRSTITWPSLSTSIGHFCPQSRQRRPGDRRSGRRHRRRQGPVRSAQVKEISSTKIFYWSRHSTSFSFRVFATNFAVNFHGENS